MQSSTETLAPSRALAALIGALALAACGTMPERGARPTASTAPARPPVTRGPVVDTPVKIGKPYQVAGQWYYPADDRGYDEVGYASWYGDAFHGGPTANGEVYDMNMVGAAHKTLPLPCYVEVTAIDTGHIILVRINDRGPFVTNRIIDLSRRAAEQLGIARQGVARVRVRRVEPGAEERLVLRSGRPAAERPRADSVVLAALNQRFERWLSGQTILLARAPDAVSTPMPATMLAPGVPLGRASLDASLIGGYFVQIGAFGDRTRADGVAATLGGSVVSQGAIHRVRTGPYFDEGAASAALAQAQAHGYQDARLVRPGAAN